MNTISAAFIALSIAAAALMSVPAQAAQVSNRLPTIPMFKIVSLGCSAGHGDVAQTVYITNTTIKTIAQGTKISWNLNGAKGSQVLDAPLGVGKTISDLAPPGNGGTCKATYVL